MPAAALASSAPPTAYAAGAHLLQPPADDVETVEDEGAGRMASGALLEDAEEVEDVTDENVENNSEAAL